MATTYPKFEGGPKTYVANSAVTGGTLVQLRSDGKIEVAPAGSVAVVGVAQKDAAPRTEPVTTSGGAFDITAPSGTTAVFNHGEFVLKYAANCNPGQTLKAGALGTVTPWVSGTDAADLIVGRCTAAAAVLANASDRARINL